MMRIDEGGTALAMVPTDPNPQQGGGSRRRRLWELPAECHAPIVGVCLPVAELRLMMNKLFGGESGFDDFHLHQGTVLQCTTRNKVSEHLQRELDRRFAGGVRCFNQAKTAESVASLWAAATEVDEFAAALWASLTHARCTAELQVQVCRDIHMLQYRAAAAVRADLAQADALRLQNQVLSAELARAQQRHAQAQAERQAEREQLQAVLLQLRAEATAKDLAIARLRERPGILDTSGPDRESREQLMRRSVELEDKLAGTRRELAVQLRENARLRAEHAVAAASIESPTCENTAATELRTAVQAAAALQSRIVLCVGGRAGHIPIYRDLVERHGGRFLHHDGGIEDNAHRLDAQLTAADLVVCQTAFLGHNAYGRVKDHCKRTGKCCVFVDKPGALKFLRGLAQVPIGDRAERTV